jgi:hypothetical protein
MRVARPVPGIGGSEAVENHGGTKIVMNIVPKNKCT